MTRLLEVIHRHCCEQFRFSPNYTMSVLRRKHASMDKRGKCSAELMPLAGLSSRSWMHVSFCTVIQKKNFLHETTLNKFCGLCWVAESWFLERAFQMHLFGSLSSTSEVLSSFIILRRRQTSSQLHNQAAHFKADIIFFNLPKYFYVVVLKINWWYNQIFLKRDKKTLWALISIVEFKCKRFQIT